MISTTEVIEVEEDQSENGGSGGCFTLDFEHCSMCEKNFLCQESAMLHYNKNHPDDMQMCPECNMLISNARTMPYHYKTKHPSITMPLHVKPSQPKVFFKRMFDEFLSNHCTVCKQNFKTNAESQFHFNDEHDIKYEICSVCMKNFRTEQHLITHWANKHKDLKFVEFKAKTPSIKDEDDSMHVKQSSNDMEKSPCTKIMPILDVVVSLVDIRHNPNALSPKMRAQFSDIAKEMDNITEKYNSSEKENYDEKGDDFDETTADQNDSKHSLDIDEEKIASQKEPLDLSTRSGSSVKSIDSEFDIAS